MAELDLTNDTDSGKAERLCAWCGAAFVAGKHNARYCGSKCKDTSRRRSKGIAPFMEPRNCEVCGDGFVAFTATRKYCGADCRQAAQLKMGRDANTLRAREYRLASPEKYRERDRKRRSEDSETFKRRARECYTRLKYERPEQYQAMLDGQRERERQRNAKAAISAILLPVQEHSEV